ncbi:MAG: peptidase M14 [Bacteroidetes bacterium QH_7_62_13]|nr:MAG: peptidase M14 [Bacteroidetes bacterium QH_7_62_13]
MQPRTSKRFFIPLVLLLTLGILPGVAQDVPLSIETPTPGTNAYDDSIPTPGEVIGHEIGTRHTRPAQAVRYFEAVAEVSDRVVLRSHGRTYQGRRLIHAVVTTPSNHDRLSEIQSRSRRLTTEPGTFSQEEMSDLPAVVNMGYSIHGDEASGTEAAILLLYHLAAGNGPDVEAALDEVVTLIDPMFNPDGRDRFVDWVNDNRGGTPTADPQDREHNQPWPGGRTNHYLFDLNRDWLPVQHPSSQGRVEYFHDWKPQVLTDFHEMGSEATYFFQPGVPERTNPNTTRRNQELTGAIAEYHADYLEDIGSLFYTRETYDDFYYGKGSTYPDVNGAIGILFEQASSRALKRETDEGDVTYAFTVRNQFMTSMSTLKAVVDQRMDLLRYQRDFFANREEALQDVEAEAYVVDRTEHSTRAQALAQVLDRHDVRLFNLGRTIQSDGETFQAGEAYVVPLDQPQGRFVKAAMERTSSYPDSIFYDVSTWTLPLAFGVDSAELNSIPSNLRGDRIEDVSYESGAVVGGRSSYAYVLPWGDYFGPRAVQRLHENNVRPRVTTDSFTAESGGQPQSFGRGSIVVQVRQRGVSPDTVHAVVQRIAEQDYVNVYAVDQGLTPSGPDLGSRGSPILEEPSVALLTGTGGGSRYGGTSAYNVGEVWHLLSERMEMPVSLLDISDVSNADLSRYNTMVLAGGDFDDVPKEAVTQWVEGGGTLIAIEDAVEWPIEQEMVDLEERTLDVDSLVQGTDYANLPEAYAAQGIGGSIFRTNLDPTHPVAYGYDESVPVFRVGTGFYEPSETPGASVGVYDSQTPRLSGYLSDEQREQARGAASIEAHEVGGGQVILFMDNPNFRAFWYGTNGLFLNAVLFGQIL